MKALVHIIMSFSEHSLSMDYAGCSVEDWLRREDR